VAQPLGPSQALSETDRAKASNRKANEIAMVLEREAGSLRQQIAERLKEAVEEAPVFEVEVEFDQTRPVFVAEVSTATLLERDQRRDLARVLGPAVRETCEALVSQRATSAGLWEASITVDVIDEAAERNVSRRKLAAWIWVAAVAVAAVAVASGTYLANR
jgi:hypothetical protein